ncbi:hypothetical protein TSAR_013755 [Trichomalopsis sarcophagae]|uniref:Uncharacterized protein n=1 Tax=Trichomalopsis sarcophagae TaxID=543379 RepID=A0A232FNN9_9HYME|nr:hypothetical protein TSAR_013755 [Trichomalopsis sarcophagae]
MPQTEVIGYPSADPSMTLNMPLTFLFKFPIFDHEELVYPEEIPNHQTRKQLFQRDKILTRSSRLEKPVNRVKADRNKYEDFFDKYVKLLIGQAPSQKGVNLFNQAIIVIDEKTLQT